MKVRNPKYNRFGTVDCEVEHPTFGWIPFTASPDDAEAHGREVYHEAIAGKHGAIGAYEPPPPLTPEEHNQQIEEEKRLAYNKEVVPLFLEAEAGLRDSSEWEKKLTEINDKYEGMKK